MEQREEHERDRRRQGGIRRRADAAEHEIRGRAADETVEALSEREAEAEDDPDDGDDDHRHEALEHRRDDVLLLDHAAVEERQPGRHEEDEAGGGQHPGHVAGDDRAGAGRGRTGGRYREPQQRRQQQQRQRHDSAHHGALAYSRTPAAVSVSGHRRPSRAYSGGRIPAPGVTS